MNEPMQVDPLSELISNDLIPTFCSEVTINSIYPREEWTMSKAKLSYIAVRIPATLKPDTKNLPYFPRVMAPQGKVVNVLLYSLAYERYSYNVEGNVLDAPINIHWCETEAEFFAFMDAIHLGASVDNLFEDTPWKKT